MQNFNAPKKGNKGVGWVYLIALILFVMGAVLAVHFDKDETKTGSADSVETQVAPAIYCTRGRRYLCAQSDDIA